MARETDEEQLSRPDQHLIDAHNKKNQQAKFAKLYGEKAAKAMVELNGNQIMNTKTDKMQYVD